MLLRTNVNRTSAMPTLWHLWIIAITALYGFHLGLSHRIPALRKAQTPPHGYSLLGFGSLTWALPYQSIRCHENTSCCPWVLPPSLSLTHPGIHTWSKSASLWLPTACRWQVVSQQQTLHLLCSLLLPQPLQSLTQGMLVMKYLSVNKEISLEGNKG